MDILSELVLHTTDPTYKPGLFNFIGIRYLLPLLTTSLKTQTNMEEP